MPIRRFRFATTVVVALAVLVSLTGCMDLEESATIKSDGKGRATLVVVFDTKKIKEIQDLMSGMGQAGGGLGGDPAKEFTPAKIKSRVKDAPGVKLVSVEEIKDEENHKLGSKTVVEFDSLESLYLAGIVPGIDAKLEKLEDGNYRFTRSVATDMRPDMEDPEMAGMVEMFFAMLEPQAGTMELDFVTTLPAAVVQTNGEKEGENKVRWAVAYKDLMDAKKLTQTVVFQGEGLDWKAFDVTQAKIAAKREARKAAQTTPSEPDPKPDGDAAPKDGATDTPAK